MEVGGCGLVGFFTVFFVCFFCFSSVPTLIEDFQTAHSYCVETVPTLKAAILAEFHCPAIMLFISLFVYLFVLRKGFRLSVFVTVYGMEEKLSQCALGSCQESLGILQSNLCWTKIWWIWSFKNKLPKRKRPKHSHTRRLRSLMLTLYSCYI